MADNKWNAFGAFLCGAALGALAGIYFAPKSGKEMREDLSDQWNEGARRARRASDKVTRRAQEIAGQVQTERIGSGGRGRARGSQDHSFVSSLA